MPQMDILSEEPLLCHKQAIGSTVLVAGDGSRECIQSFARTFRDEIFARVLQERVTLFRFDERRTPLWQQEELGESDVAFFTRPRNRFDANCLWHYDPSNPCTLLSHERTHGNDNRLIVPTLLSPASRETIWNAFVITYTDQVLNQTHPLAGMRFDDPNPAYARGRLCMRYPFMAELVLGQPTDIPEEVRYLMTAFCAQMNEILSPFTLRIGDADGGLLAIDTECAWHARGDFHDPTKDVLPVQSHIYPLPPERLSHKTHKNCTGP